MHIIFLYYTYNVTSHDRIIMVHYITNLKITQQNIKCKVMQMLFRNKVMQMPFLFVAMQIAMSFSYHPSEIMLGFFYFYE
jgi:hypothetical protein